MIKTTDICDHFSDQIQIAEPMFGDFGGQAAFHGPISTVKVFEDNVLLRQALEEPGEGRVLVVDGGAALLSARLRCTTSWQKSNQAGITGLQTYLLPVAILLNLSNAPLIFLPI